MALDSSTISTIDDPIFRPRRRSPLLCLTRSDHPPPQVSESIVSRLAPRRDARWFSIVQKGKLTPVESNQLWIGPGADLEVYMREVDRLESVDLYPLLLLFYYI
ncbi:hypothetical protein PGTUg99_002018 [Puccinia graminis f. sp. tritici]|uniref:Uncharacterized protein n=1 Tax=Puccinia graminis f. sp. tritici TaxID=56615 RepID=A0A5B0RQV5_PUCGR|nr:hypothetical protein PGTUg99_017093 [Puccinia graminis f. sp. tritici]KAA1129864.1 hypothetical protein PGTUg99_002018 [Puccinia graminis f. sp. tritici]